MEKIVVICGVCAFEGKFVSLCFFVFFSFFFFCVVAAPEFVEIFVSRSRKNANPYIFRQNVLNPYIFATPIF
jgi:hypothetical protein